MKKRQTEKSTTPPVILMVRADELSRVVDNGLKVKVKIVQANDPHGALNSFNAEHPALIVCNVDEKGNRYNSLFRRAAAKKVPVIALATTDEAVEAVQNVSHFLDRRAVRAVVTLSQRLLDDPSFVPESLTSYPPPPKTEESSQPGFRSGSASQSKVITLTSVTPSTAGGSTLPGLVSSENGAGENTIAGRVSQLSSAMAALRQRLDTLEAYTRSELQDNGSFINAVAAENAAFYEELKGTIRQVAENAHRTTESLRTAIDELLSQTPTSDSAQEARLEELRKSLNKRDSQIDALRTALVSAEAKGSERESDFREQIDSLVNQVTRLSSEPPPAPGIGSASVEDLLADYENRFADIEIALSRLEKSGPTAKGSPGSNFTSEFEDLWDTQLLVNQLQRRVDTLEKRAQTGSGAPASAGSAPETLPSDVSKAIESLKQRLSGMDDRFSRTDKTVSDKLEQLQETQIDIIKRLHAIEKAAKSTGPSQAEQERAAEKQRYEEMAERLARMEAFLAGWEEAQASAQAEEADRRDDPEPVRDTLQSVKGTMRSWSTEPPPNGNNVVQRSIIKTSSVPPSANSPRANSDAPKKRPQNATIIGMESPISRTPKGSKR